ncbi:hypothetical protein Bca101_062113 [Brassica carinata]
MGNIPNLRFSLSLLQKTPTTPATNLEPHSSSTYTHQVHGIPKKSSPSSHSEDPTVGPSTNLHEVHSFSRSKSVNSLPSLAVTVAAPSPSHIMEETPSQEKIPEDSHTSEQQRFGQNSPQSQNNHQIHPEIPLVFGNDNDLLLIGETSGYNIIRGGRPIKPTGKIQGTEWTNVRGKGKRGRRGQGN